MFFVLLRQEEGEAAVDLKLIASYESDNRFITRFASSSNLSKLNLNENDFIMLSTNQRICYDLGFVEKIGISEITIKTEK